MSLFRRVTVVGCLFAVIAVASGCGPVPAGPYPGVTSAEGTVVVVDRPSTVVPNENEADAIRVFRERNDFELSEPLTVEAAESGTYGDSSSLSEETVGTDRPVDVFYFHADTPSDSDDNKQATVTFDRPIAGVVLTEEAMVEANDDLEISSLSTRYPSSDNPDFGIRLDEGDQLEISPDGRTLTIDLVVWASSDSFRVVLRD